MKTFLGVALGGDRSLGLVLHRQREGVDVVLLEGDRIGARTSGHTTGKVTSQHGAIYARLADRHGLDTAQQYATAKQRERRAATSAVYHGTIQLVVSPHARGMNGRWLGFGKNFIVNSGDWHLEWREA